jgi:hypothetical protein
MQTLGRLTFAVAAAVALLTPGSAPADGPFVLHTITPCRLADTRNPAGPTGGPALDHDATRSFPVQGQCGVPVGAKAAVLNVTAVQASPASGQGHLRLFPSGASLPLVSSVNFSGNDFAVANNAIVPLSSNANDLSVYAFLLAGSGTVHMVLDVTGYFAPAPAPTP